MDQRDDRHVAALIERIGRLLHTDSHAEGLLPVQWEILRYLERANRFSPYPSRVDRLFGAHEGNRLAITGYAGSAAG